MNRIYRLVWGRVSNSWVVVAENAKGRGKATSGRKLIAADLALAASVLLAPLALAAPTGGQVSAGSGAIAQVGAITTITQSSQNLAINWQSFGIGVNEAVNFVQPNASAIALNRVLGQDPSQILGNLSANGQVFILNPNGVLFGTGSQVNVGGLVASTLSLSDVDFIAGKHTFSNGGTAGAVVNRGTLTAAQGGFIALLAPEVRNEGVISATLGTALLLAGDKVTLTLNNGSLLGYSIDQGALNALAENKQLIQTDGGQVFMSAKAANALTTAMVNNTGIIEARTVQNVAGVIMLMGDMQVGSVNVGGTLDASAPNSGNGGFIETSAAHVNIADNAKITTLASNGLTGTWLIDPTNFTIAAGSGALTTSGIGATTLSNNLGSTSVIIATAVAGAEAGDIFVNSAVTWAANKLTLSAHNNININANLNASGAASLALVYGQGAVALNNTSNIITKGAAVNLPAGTTNFTTKQGSNGTIKNYTVITSLGLEGSTTTTDLQGVKGNLGVNYALGQDINAADTSTWNSNAGFAPIGNLVTPFAGTFDGLGHTISNLTINRPAASYVGLFGYVNTVSTIRNVGLVSASVSGDSAVGGLVGYNDGTVSNSYATGSVTGGNGSSYIGGLIGGSVGTVSNSYATGSVTGGTGSSYVGGLMGYNILVSNSYATVNVVSGSSSSYVGGLVGKNSADFNGSLGGWVINSYATGSVTGGVGSSYVGGLVGSNGTVSNISNSYWDTQTSGHPTTGIGAGTTTGATGRTTAEMRSMASFTGFNIANTGGSSAVWRIYEGNTTPWLMWWLKPLTVTANSDSKTYNGATYSGGNGVTYSVASPNPALSGTLGYSGTSQSAVNAGSYTLGASGLYSIQQGYDISYVDGNLSINRAILTVTADDKSRLYGQANPALTTTVSGFVNGETAGTAAGFAGTGSATTLAGPTTNVGTAAITAGAGNLAATNYAFTNLVDGNLSITLAEIITPPAGGILPAVVEAIIALPGGADLLPAFSNTAVVVATQIDAVPPPPVLSNLQYVYVATTTPGNLSGDIDTSVDGKAVPTKAQSNKSDGFNERLADAPIQFTGTVLVRNGGIRLPGDADDANARDKKQGNK